MLTATKRAAVYVRVSTKGQEQEGTSLETQEAACLAYVQEHEYTVQPEHIYREVHTAIELWERPQLTSLREAARAHDFDVLIAYAIDRLSRDPDHLGVIISEAAHFGVAVEFVSEPLDDSEEGRLFRYIRGYAARVEHGKITLRTMTGRKARAKSGKLSGGRTLYGYAWVDPQPKQKTKYRLEGTTDRVVRRVWEEFIEQRLPLGRIAAGLDADGIQTPMGKERWSLQSIKNILTQPAYAGRGANWRWRTEHIKGLKQPRMRLRSQEEWVPLSTDVVPPIVPEHWYDLAGEILVSNKAQAARNNRHPEDYLFRGGLAVCTNCGGILHTVVDHDSYVYRCANAMRRTGLCDAGVSITARRLDSEAWEKITQFLTDPDLVVQAMWRMQADDAGGERAAADFAAVDRALSEVDRKARNLANRLGDIDDEDMAALVTDQVNALGTQRKALQAERQAVLDRRNAWEQARARLNDIAYWCKSQASNLSAMRYAEKRLMLSKLNARAYVYPADHDPRVEVEMELRFSAETHQLKTEVIASTLLAPCLDNPLRLRLGAA